MKAIAFAIIIASFTLIPKAEFEAYSKQTQDAMGGVYLLCVVAFILCIALETNK